MLDSIKNWFHAYVSNSRDFFRGRLSGIRKRFLQLRYQAERTLFTKRTRVVNRISQRLTEKSSQYLTLSYFIIAIGFSLSLTPYTLDTDANITDFIFGSAAMMGGALAIIITFHALLVNFAIEQYPAEFYRLTGYDKRLDAMYYSLGGLTVLQFTAGIVFVKDDIWARSGLTSVSILILLTSLYVLFAAMNLVRSRLDPISGIRRIHQTVVGLLDKADAFGVRYEKMQLLNPSLTDEERRRVGINTYPLLSNTYDSVNSLLGFLQNYHGKLLAKNDDGAARMIIDSMGRIMARFIEVNKNRLLPMMSPSNPLNTTTIAEPFFNTNYERLLFIAEGYINAGKTDGLIKLVEVWQHVATGTTLINYHGLIHDNPELDRAILYFGMVVQRAMEKGDTNALFELTKAYQVFGYLTIQTSNEAYLLHIYNKLDEIHNIAIKLAKDELHYQVTMVVASIFLWAIDSRKYDYRTISTHQKALKHATIKFLVSGSEVSSNNVDEFLTQPYRALWQVAHDLVPQASNFANTNRLKEQKEIIRNFRIIYETLHTICSSYPIGDKLITINFNPIIEGISDELAIVSAKRSWATNKAELLTLSKNFAHLYGWYIHNLQSPRPERFNSSVESAAIIGLKAIDRSLNEVAKASIDSIFLIAKSMLEYEKISLFSAPREMATVGFLGLNAFVNGNIEVAKYARARVREFNSAYFKKRFPHGTGQVDRQLLSHAPYPNHVYYEIKNELRTVLNNPYGGIMSLERAKAYVAQRKISPDVLATYIRFNKQ